MAIEISAQKREAQGTGASRRLRRMGRVPGILYGGEQGPVNIELEQQALLMNLRSERFHATILTLDLAGTKEQVLLRAVNMHPFKPQVQHVDFQRVQKNKKIHMKVPLHFVNAEQSPGVKEQGGVVNHVQNDLAIVCLPDDLPEFIEVDLVNLAVGKSIHVREIGLPRGVELALHKDENPVVATVVVPVLITEEEEAAAAAAAVAPSEIPATEQAAPGAEGEAAAEGAAGKGGEKAAAKPGADKGAPAGDKGAAKPAADKGDKKDKK